MSASYPYPMRDAIVSRERLEAARYIRAARREAKSKGLYREWLTGYWDFRRLGCKAFYAAYWTYHYIRSRG